MKVLKIDVIVTEEVAYRINMRSSYKDAAKVLLKKKLERLVDKLVDESDIQEEVAGPGTKKYTLRIGYDKEETK